MAFRSRHRHLHRQDRARLRNILRLREVLEAEVGSGEAMFVVEATSLAITAMLSNSLRTKMLQDMACGDRVQTIATLIRCQLRTD